jgi:flagellar export protein FliJ
MGFRFPLAAVLGFRESLERREELALKKIQLEMARVQHEIEQVTAELARAQQIREEHMSRPIPAAHLQDMLSDAETAVQRKKALLESLAVLEQQRTEQLTIYQAAHRARRMLSDLEAQHREAWEQQQVRLQQKTIDDIFASRSQRG